MRPSPPILLYCGGFADHRCAGRGACWRWCHETAGCLAGQYADQARWAIAVAALTLAVAVGVVMLLV